MNKELIPSKSFNDPFSTMRREMDRMFERFFGSRSLPALSGATGQLTGRTDTWLVPDIDITETDDAIVLSAELPGLDEKDIDLVVANGLLTLKGEKKYEHDEEKENVHVMERSYGSFQRSIRLPESVDEDAITADFKNGVLTVTMTKTPGAREAEKKIPIGGKSRSH